MGYNLVSACHKCKVRKFHFRNEEHLTVRPFYIEHRLCSKEDINNVQTIMDNNGTCQDWQYNDEYKE